jgi:hypothetical protein
MRFTFALLLSAIAIVSALPIAEVQRDLDARDEFDVDLFERNPDTRYQAALHRANIGTEDEHWSLQFHPHPENTEDKKWHEVHALSKPGQNGVLQTEWTPGKKDFVHGYAGKPGTTAHHHVIGEFANQAKAIEASKSVSKNVHMEGQFPGHNCVDCTKEAVDHLVNKKHIKDDDKVKEFHKIVQENKETVRKTTGTDAKKALAGVPAPKEEKKEDASKSKGKGKKSGKK